MSLSILSIDPSLSSTGYCIIEKDTRKIIKIGRYTTKNNISENDRIRNIVIELFDIFSSDDSINEIALEDGFSNSKNLKTGLQLAKLRGGIITYFRISGIPVYTQEPKETRKNLGLKGNAKKEEVANKVLELYPELIDRIGPYSDKNNKQKTSDMYDAVCIGIAHLNKQELA
jgi:crossover junction endodeoxyribonuclease RuvC